MNLYSEVLFVGNFLNGKKQSVVEISVTCFFMQSKKAKRRLRQPAVVPEAFAKVMKKLGFCA